MAHVSRSYGALARIKALIEEDGVPGEGGTIGRLRLVRAYGKCDRPGGGQDPVVLGARLLHLMSYFGGDPRWVHALFTQDGHDVTAAHARAGDEDIDPRARNGVVAY